MLAIAAVLFALLAPAHTPAPRPALQLLGTHPVRVLGLHFRAGESVRVTLHAGDWPSHTRVRAGRRGSFSATVGHVAAGNCMPFTVTAVGASGDRARTRKPCMD